jgi:hypothetical protein
MCRSYDALGRLPSAGNPPQHYWQCSEVMILPSDPDAPIAPTAPNTVAPVALDTLAPPVVMDTLAPVVEEMSAPLVQDTLSPVMQDTAAPVSSAPVITVTLAPVVIETQAPVSEEPCTSGGDCGAAPGKNQTHCNNTPDQTVPSDDC